MHPFDEVWVLICEYCKKHLTDVAYRTWITRINPYKVDHSKKIAYLLTPSTFHRGIIEGSYTSLLTDAAVEIFGEGYSVKFIVQEEIKEIDEIDALNLNQRQKTSDEFTFDNYIVGTSNKFAHAAAMAVAENPAGAYNPLFIYGSSGLGKTHLLYAICNEVKQNNPDLKVTYVKSEDFTNELVESLRKATMSDFRQKYRQSDVLLIDDVHFIGGKESTQEEFFHTFNTLYESQKQIVLTSDRPPKEIKTLEDRIRARFEWGLLADVQAPDMETRVAIIRNKCLAMGVPITDDLCEYIALKLKSNIRQLEGVVKKLNAKCVLMGEKMSIDVANEAIRDVISDPDMPKPLTVERIIDEVVKAYGVTSENIRSLKNKKAELARARQIAIYLVREITHLSMTKIGEEFGGRHYSTIVYNIKQVEEEMKNDPSLKAFIEDMINNIRG